MYNIENERLKECYFLLNNTICQVLGKALNYYPWYKDDKINFPDATEDDGVCVGEGTAESVAYEAADRLKELTTTLLNTYTYMQSVSIQDIHDKEKHNKILENIRKILFLNK